MPAYDPSERALVARLAAHERWARTADRTAATAAARKAAADRFESQVDPDGLLPPADRARLAESARKAFFTRLALKSAQARRARHAAAELDAEVDAALASAVTKDGGDARA
ncbi:hypothetical protein ACFT9M_25460 [Micromonospora purpureochromogenes]|uniref:hypothetical protein n=1 Tax=Micromonospora purpureochromogenes TaxID=47872 RepID=UPI00362911B5